ncbi:unnamed protein product [Calypogeia fissa]
MTLCVRNVAPSAQDVEQTEKVASTTKSSRAKAAMGATKSTPVKGKVPTPAKPKEATWWTSCGQKSGFVYK